MPGESREEQPLNRGPGWVNPHFGRALWAWLVGALMSSGAWEEAWASPDTRGASRTEKDRLRLHGVQG